MRLRPNAAPTLATHLRHTFPEQLQLFVCIIDHVNSDTSDRWLVVCSPNPNPTKRVPEVLRAPIMQGTVVFGCCSAELI